MAYFPITPDLVNGSVLTQDHIRHIEDGVAGAYTYADVAVANVQAGAVTPEAIDSGITRAVTEGRIPQMEPAGVEVTETLPGAYQFVSGPTEAMIYGLTSEQTLPPAAKTDLRTDFATKEEFTAGVPVPDPAVPGAYLIGE